MEEFILINAFFLFFFGALCGAWLVYWRCERRRYHDDIREEERFAEAQEALEQAEGELHEQKEQYRQVELQLVETRETLRGAQENVQDRQQQLAARDKDIQRLNQAQTELQSHNRALEVRLEQEQAAAAEKLALLQKAGEDVQNRFENLAQRIFAEHSRQFTDTSKASMDAVLKPLQEQLGSFRKRVDDVYDREARDRQGLHNEIVQLKSLNERLNQEALNLTRALKGDSKRRGDWGEVVLERVLEASGLVRGREYRVQYSLQDEQGRQQRPDVVVQLPQGRHVVIDSKVSLNAYTDYCNADQEAERVRLASEHLAALRKQVSELAGRNYPALAGLNSPDMVLMFVPVESALLLACEQDSRLFQDSFREGVILVSPSTLGMNLQLIHNLWRYEHQNRNTRNIVAQAAALHDKFAGFIEALQGIGRQLDAAQDSWQLAYKRLTSGRGNLLKRVSELRQLGVEGKKQLPLEGDTLSETAQAPDTQSATDQTPGRQIAATE